MTQHSHQTAPTQFVDAAGVRFAYRRFGKKQGVPLVFNIHFTGTMDHWDPALTDGFARDREVILFNNAGISSSSGDVPESIDEMAENAAALVDALGLAKIDLLIKLDEERFTDPKKCEYFFSEEHTITK